ncbi:MAG TPA: PIG-L family deacetylase [Methylomirabilota bacterium]|nr:PIG-L family deacetylase [Methylomirabilota bacterium]
MAIERTLMFVGAHPDDESFGPGGTLAKYAAAGVRVVYVCATRGEAGESELHEASAAGSLGARRWEELQRAAAVLGLAEVIYLGYRDSGMAGALDNQHPRALIAAPIERVAQDVVAAIRKVRPHVVMTFDSIGGYHHPDHIAIHRATVRAFHQAGRADGAPGLGAPWAPAKLYFWVPSRTLLRLAVGAMRLVGRDPSRHGRNRDVDLTRIAAVDFPVHTRIRLYGRAIARKQAARECHRSQVAAPPATWRMASMLARYVGSTDLFSLAHPQPRNGLHEGDLFEGVTPAKDCS